MPCTQKREEEESRIFIRLLFPAKFIEFIVPAARHETKRKPAMCTWRRRGAPGGGGSRKAPAVENCLASRGSGLDQNRLWLGLVDLSRISSGTVFREVHPALERGYEHRQNRLLPGVGDLAPKARQTFFYESSESKSALFLYRRPQGIYAGLTSKLQREQTTGTPPFCFPSAIRPI